MASSSSSSSSSAASQPQILSRTALPSLIQSLDASDVLECYHLTRHAPLHLSFNTTSPIKVTKMAIGLRYRPPANSNKPPLELTLEYGPQRMALQREALPLVVADEQYVTWQNEAKVYYTTSSIVSSQWESAYFMASMTGAVLEKLLGKAVTYARPRYQPFVVYQDERIVLKSSSSGDFLSYLWEEMALLGVEIRPILPPPVMEARLHVSGIEKVAAGQMTSPQGMVVSQEAALFYGRLQHCVAAISTGDYSEYEPTAAPTSSSSSSSAPSLMPSNNEANDTGANVTKDVNVTAKSVAPIDTSDNQHQGKQDDDNKQQDGNEDGDDKAVDDQNKEPVRADQDEDEQLGDEPVENGEEKEDDDKDGDHDDDKDEEDGDAVDEQDDSPAGRQRRYLHYWNELFLQSHVVRRLWSTKNVQSSRNEQKIGEEDDEASVISVDDGIVSWNDTALIDENVTNSPTVAPHDEAEQANKAAHEAKEAAHEAKEAATTEADNKAADAAEAAANAAQKAADATSLKQQQVAMENLLSGDGAAMSTSLVTCFTNHQYQLTDVNGTVAVYLYWDGATYFRLNLTAPYLDVVRVDRPIPKPPSAEMGSGGGDIVDWSLLLFMIMLFAVGVVITLQRNGFRFLRPLYRQQKRFFSPSEEYESDDEELQNALQGYEHSFGEDVIPFSMGGRRPNGEPSLGLAVGKRRIIAVNDSDDLFMKTTDGHEEDHHPGDVEMVTDVNISSPRWSPPGSSESSRHTNGRRLSGPIILDLNSRMAKDPDLVDLPNLNSTSKVAVPVAIEHQRSQSRELADDSFGSNGS